MTMELRQIEYFVSVAETGGFGKAAKKCHVAQPSLSQQISKLEREFGQRLFDRMGRTIALTEAGENFLPRARSILAEVQQAKQTLTNNVEAGHGKLSIGIIPTLTPFILNGTVKRFKACYPDAELIVSEDVTETLQERLMNAEVEVCYMSTPLTGRQIVTEDIFTEKLFLAVSATHPYAALSPLTSEALSKTPFVTLHDRHCLSQQISSFCYVHHINPPIIYQTYQLATVLDFVRAGLGIAFVPEIATLTLKHDDVVFRSVEDISPERTIVAARCDGRTISQLAACFTDCIKQEWSALTQTDNP